MCVCVCVCSSAVVAMVPHKTSKHKATIFFVSTVLLLSSLIGAATAGVAIPAVATNTSAPACTDNDCTVTPGGFHTSSPLGLPGEGSLSTGDSCQWPGLLLEVPPVPHPNSFVGCSTSDSPIDYHLFDDCVPITAVTIVLTDRQEDKREFGFGC